MKRFLFVSVAAALLGLPSAPAQDSSSVIVSQETAQRHGLHRAWLTQVEIDRARDRVQAVVYYIPDPPKRMVGKKAADPSGFELLGKEKKEEAKPEGEEKAADPKEEKAEGDNGAQPPDEKQPAEKEEPKEAEPPPKAPPPIPEMGGVQDHGTVYVQSRRGVLQAFDAGSGRTIWVTQVGNREKPSEPPAVNAEYIAVVNGTDLYVLDRRDGGIVFRKGLNDVPTAGLAISREWIFVPMISGNVVAYKLPDINLRALPEAKSAVGAKPKELSERERRLRDMQRAEYGGGQIPTMRFASFSPVVIPPLVTRNKLAWTESRGRIYLAQKDRPQVDSRFDALEPITAPLTYWRQHIFAASRDGYVYALHELRGTVSWRFSVGEPMNQPPVPMDDAIYATADTGGMYCLDLRSGDQRWWAPGIKSFLAASSSRLYVADNTGAMQVLDRASGARLDSIRIDRLDLRVTNLRSDRIFIGTHTGVLQCLHESQQTDPLIHVLPADTFELAKPKEEQKPKEELKAKEETDLENKADPKKNNEPKE
jgi:outer membrane protein assembly factor BamB